MLNREPIFDHVAHNARCQSLIDREVIKDRVKGKVIGVTQREITHTKGPKRIALKVEVLDKIRHYKPGDVTTWELNDVTVVPEKEQANEVEVPKD